MKTEELIKQIETLHQRFIDNDGVNGWDQKTNQEIISLIENVPEKERTDELIGFLARAYNNDSRYLEAIKLLELVKEENRDDKWLYRMGYALHYLADEENESIEMYKMAHHYFSQIKEYDEDTHRFIVFENFKIREKENNYDALEANKNKVLNAEQRSYIEICSDIQKSIMNELSANPDKELDELEVSMILLYRLESAIYNGGFMQLLYNWGAEHINMIGKFLDHIGAEKHVDLLIYFADKYKEAHARDDIETIYDIAIYLEKNAQLNSQINPAYWELDENIFEKVYQHYQNEIKVYMFEHNL